jgi:2-dehydro-3-deoxygluconokinase
LANAQENSMQIPGSGPILCFGEVLIRLSTARGARFANAAKMRVDVGGAESNVAALLAQLGHGVEMISVVPESDLGALCVSDLRRYGVGTQNVARAEGRVGIYYFEAAATGGRIIYDRDHSAFSQYGDGFDWQLLAVGSRWFHLSGINLALGGKAARGAAAAVAAMNNAGVPISFDVNHRASLWAGKSAAELAAVRDVAATADVLFASAADISRMLGGEFGADSAEERRRAAEAAFGAFERLQLIASTRRLFDGREHGILVRIDRRDAHYETGVAPLRNVIDRIGSGDAFAGAVIDAILHEVGPEACAMKGLAAAVAKHGISGDRWIGTSDELADFDPFNQRDVRR